MQERRTPEKLDPKSNPLLFAEVLCC